MSEDDKFQYEERFIAFVDLLGFKEFILNEELDVLVKVIQLLRSEAANKSYIIEKDNYTYFMVGPSEGDAIDRLHSSRQISVFSDLIVISYPVTSETGSPISNLHKLLHSIYFVQEHLSINSVLIRGGISCGKLYHEGDICVGPALLRAYELEQKYARFPRVIIDPSIVLQDRFKGIIGRWPDYLEQFGDDYYFITHFKPLRTFFDMYGEEHLRVQVETRRYQIRQILYAYKLAIERALKSKEIQTQEKGEWLLRQYVTAVKYFEGFYTFTDSERRYIDIEKLGEAPRT